MKLFKRFFKKNRVTTSTLLQMEATECGAASLRIILDYHKVYSSLEELRDLCGISRDGSNALSIVKVAKQFNLESAPINIDIPQINKKVIFPAILFWSFNHFLVLEGYDEEKKIFYLNDPASGRRTADYREFDESFTGIVLNFKKDKNFKPMGSPVKTYSRFIPLLRESKYDVLFIAMATLLLVVPGLTIPVFSKIFIDDILINQFDSLVAPLIIGMIIVLIVQAILMFLQQITLVLLGVKLSVVSATHFMTHILKLPIMFFSQRYLGDIADRANLNEKIAMTLSHNISVNIINLLTSLIYGTVLLMYDIYLGLIAIIIMLLNFVVLRMLRSRQNDANQVMFKEKAMLLGVSMNGLRIIDTLKSSGMEQSFFRKWSGYQAKMLNAVQRLAVYSYILNLTPSFLSSLAIMIVIYLGSFKILDGVMTVGTLIAFQSLMSSFMAPISNLVGFAGELQVLKGDIDRTNDVFNYKADPLILSSEKNEIGTYENLSGKIEFKNLVFTYSRFAPPLFDKFNLVVEPGIMLAIVGGSGSGKSTLIKLLSRLYYPTEGEIDIDGININQIDRFLFSRSVSVVSQDIVLFQGSIRDNLTFWDNSVSEDDINHALKDAGIFDVVNRLPGGYDYKIEENGKNFSGGQRQCLEIARALVNNPSILILDEATSALDSILESIVINNLKRRGCTCIFVAHRLSAVRDAHKIIVMDEGKIVQTGIHNDLIKEDNIYKSLVTSQ